jgi:hypothetical protein
LQSKYRSFLALRAGGLDLQGSVVCRALLNQIIYP